MLGAVHKRRPQSGGEGLSSADIFRTRGKEVLQMRIANIRTSWWKYPDFLKFVVCPQGQGGRASADKRGGD